MVRVRQWLLGLGLGTPTGKQGLGLTYFEFRVRFTEFRVIFEPLNIYLINFINELFERVYCGRPPPREGWVQGEARWGHWGRSPLFLFIRISTFFSLSKSSMIRSIDHIEKFCINYTLLCYSGSNQVILPYVGCIGNK